MIKLLILKPSMDTW